MSDNFGYLDIILLAMFAGFIILRLRKILGRKTGHQGKSMDKYFSKGLEIDKDKDKDIDIDNLIFIYIFIYIYSCVYIFI